MAWTVLPFSKYKGKTLPQVVLTDPDWFFWAVEEQIFTSAALRAQAGVILHKATHIRIPDTPSLDSRVEYVIDPGVGKLADVKIVPANRPSHEGASPTLRVECFDLSMPRKISEYDKTGGKIILRAIKHYVFGNENARLTQRRCEQFFDDDSNFS